MEEIPAQLVYQAPLERESGDQGATPGQVQASGQEDRPRLGARGQQWPGQEPGQGGQEPGARPALLDLDALGAQIA